MVDSGQTFAKPISARLYIHKSLATLYRRFRRSRRTRQTGSRPHQRLGRTVSEPRCSRDTKAYHDEGTAQRLRAHLNLLSAMETWLPREDIEWMHSFLDRTAHLLLQDEFYSGQNNHGMFQDIGLIEFAALASWRSIKERSKILETALERIHIYFAACFTPEGVHVENTPTYHVMVSRAVAQHISVLKALRHPETFRFEQLFQKLSRYATHAVMPNGLFPRSATHIRTHWSVTAVFSGRRSSPTQ